MSLNFVSTTVLSSTDGVSHNTETRLETSAAGTSTQTSGSYKPLYEQLRKNQQDEQDKYDEMTKAMRGSQALDEEDIAHLEVVENERAERLRQQALKEKEELESFRLAKLDFHEANKAKQIEKQEEEDLIGKASQKDLKVAENVKAEEANNSSLTKLKSNIKLKKKRRRKQISETDTENIKMESATSSKKVKAEKGEGESKIASSKREECSPGLSGLLQGYDSDSE